MALLAVDKNGSVREELYRTVACWLRELNERREHECRLLPYVAPPHINVKRSGVCLCNI